MMAGAKFVILGLCIILLQSFTVNADGHDVETKILILGAGPAGLRAAERLLENGVTDFMILESGTDIGGLSQRLTDIGGVTVNTGDIFGNYHTVEDDEALREKGLSFTRYSWIPTVRNDRNEDITAEYNERYTAMDAARTAAYKDIIEPVLAGKRPAVSAKTGMALKGWVATSALDRVTQWFDFDFNEGVPMEDVSMAGELTQYLRTEVEASWYFITDFADGFYPVLRTELINGNHVEFQMNVASVDQSGEKVLVTAMKDDQEGGNSEPHVYAADYVISTLSVGVLQHGLVFEPPLPEWKTEQIYRFQSSTGSSIYLKFASKFWEDSEWILHASDREIGQAEYWPAFLNLDRVGFHPGSNILVAALSKAEAVRVESLTEEQVKEEVMGVLRLMYGEENVSELEEIKYDHVTGAPHYGTFKTWPVDVTNPPDLHRRMGARVGKVFFADQAGSEVHLGRQVGGEEEAERVVGEILECMKGECPPEYSPVPYLQCKDDSELYGCVKVLKKEGKTRKVFLEDKAEK